MAKAMSVQVKQCQLRSSPSFLGRIVTSLDYGDRVEVEKEENSWARVASSGKNEGWVHISALSEKEIILDPGSREIRQAASSDEIALAGKGFNRQVEERYKEKNRNIDFAPVDRMEKIVIARDEILDFVRTGGLKERRGA
jgi:hypothetical protein